MADLPSVNTDEIEAIARIAGGDADSPVFMLNINKYTKEARYPHGQIYTAYTAVPETLVTQVDGKLLWRTSVLGQVIGDRDADEVSGIWYPSHQAFVNLMAAPASGEKMRLRGLTVAHADLHRCDVY